MSGIKLLEDRQQKTPTEAQLVFLLSSRNPYLKSDTGLLPREENERGKLCNACYIWIRGNLSNMGGV